MKFLFKMLDIGHKDSLATRKRRKRFQLFRQLVAGMPRPLTILDVGGTEAFWRTMEFAHEPEINIVLLNIEKVEVTLPNFTSVIGDASDMSGFKDKEFDVIFSNSVIEHLVGYSRQAKMADEIRRVGKRYFVQTPNRFFPIEPHFQFPFFQFLPPAMKTFLLCNFELGWYKRMKDRSEAMEAAGSIRLLTKKEFTGLFEGGTLCKEKFFGLTKSFVVYDGWR